MPFPTTKRGVSYIIESNEFLKLSYGCYLTSQKPSFTSSGSLCNTMSLILTEIGQQNKLQKYFLKIKNNLFSKLPVSYINVRHILRTNGFKRNCSLLLILSWKR